MWFFGSPKCRRQKILLFEHVRSFFISSDPSPHQNTKNTPSSPPHCIMFHRIFCSRKPQPIKMPSSSLVSHRHAERFFAKISYFSFLFESYLWSILWSILWSTLWSTFLWSILWSITNHNLDHKSQFLIQTWSQPVQIKKSLSQPRNLDHNDHKIDHNFFHEG